MKNNSNLINNNNYENNIKEDKDDSSVDEAKKYLVKKIGLDNYMMN